MNFDRKELNYFKNIFGFFDKSGTDQIYTKDLHLAIRAAGGLVTNLEISRLVTKIDPHNSGNINYNDYLYCLTQLRDKSTDRNAIENVFKVLDKDDTKSIKAAELKHLLTKIGEPLTEDELNTFLENFDIQNGKISLDRIVDVLNFDPKIDDF